jgi:predicted nucleotidyltransferase component of viral defense system
MIEKRLVQWYAADAGVDLDIAEREVVLTYVLRVMLDTGLLAHLAFKGGTAIRKIILGNQGRFSLDLDFTMLDDFSPDEFILDIAGALHGREHYGIEFDIRSEDYYANPDSCGAIVTYRHSWAASGKFSIQISFRARPLLPVRPAGLIEERYFQWLEIQPPQIPMLDLHEIIAEKIRATAQRSRIRDLYDLYQFASLRFDRSTVRRLAILKCWETNFALDPVAFLAQLPGKQYDWADLERLVKHGRNLSPGTVYEQIRQGYRFLTEMDEAEAVLAGDPYRRERKTYQQLLASLGPSHL